MTIKSCKRPAKGHPFPRRGTGHLIPRLRRTLRQLKCTDRHESERMSEGRQVVKRIDQNKYT